MKKGTANTSMKVTLLAMCLLIASVKKQELDVIRSGMIQYKNAEIQEVSVRFIGTTAVLLNRIRLVAVVGGNEVINPFVVTEVHVQQSGTWKLGSLSFTRLLGQ